MPDSDKHKTLNMDTLMEAKLEALKIKEEALKMREEALALQEKVLKQAKELMFSDASKNKKVSPDLNKYESLLHEINKTGPYKEAELPEWAQLQENTYYMPTTAPSPVVQPTDNKNSTGANQEGNNLSNKKQGAFKKTMMWDVSPVFNTSKLEQQLKSSEMASVSAQTDDPSHVLTENIQDTPFETKDFNSSEFPANTIPDFKLPEYFEESEADTDLPFSEEEYEENFWKRFNQNDIPDPEYPDKIEYKSHRDKIPSKNTAGIRKDSKGFLFNISKLKDFGDADINESQEEHPENSNNHQNKTEINEADKNSDEFVVTDSTDDFNPPDSSPDTKNLDFKENTEKTELFTPDPGNAPDYSQNAEDLDFKENTEKVEQATWEEFMAEKKQSSSPETVVTDNDEVSETLAYSENQPESLNNKKVGNNVSDNTPENHQSEFTDHKQQSSENKNEEKKEKSKFEKTVMLGAMPQNIEIPINNTDSETSENHSEDQESESSETPSEPEIDAHEPQQSQSELLLDEDMFDDDEFDFSSQKMEALDKKFHQSEVDIPIIEDKPEIINKSTTSNQVKITKSHGKTTAEFNFESKNQTSTEIKEQLSDNPGNQQMDISPDMYDSSLENKTVVLNEGIRSTDETDLSYEYTPINDNQNEVIEGDVIDKHRETGELQNETDNEYNEEPPLPEDDNTPYIINLSEEDIADLATSHSGNLGISLGKFFVFMMTGLLFMASGSLITYTLIGGKKSEHNQKPRKETIAQTENKHAATPKTEKSHHPVKTEKKQVKKEKHSGKKQNIQKIADNKKTANGQNKKNEIKFINPTKWQVALPLIKLNKTDPDSPVVPATVHNIEQNTENVNDKMVKAMLLHPQTQKNTQTAGCIECVNEANLSMGKRNYYRAVELYKRSLKLKNNDANTHALLSLAYHKINKDNEALKEANTALAYDPFNPWALLVAGSTMQLKNNTEAALKYFRRYVALPFPHPFKNEVKSLIANLTGKNVSIFDYKNKPSYGYYKPVPKPEAKPKRRRESPENILLRNPL